MYLMYVMRSQRSRPATAPFRRIHVPQTCWTSPWEPLAFADAKEIAGPYSHSARTTTPAACTPESLQGMHSPATTLDSLLPLQVTLSSTLAAAELERSISSASVCTLSKDCASPRPSYPANGKRSMPAIQGQPQWVQKGNACPNTEHVCTDAQSAQLEMTWSVTCSTTADPSKEENRHSPASASSPCNQQASPLALFSNLPAGPLSKLADPSLRSNLPRTQSIGSLLERSHHTGVCVYCLHRASSTLASVRMLSRNLCDAWMCFSMPSSYPI